MSRLGQKDEFIRTVAPPPRWDGDPILLVNGMPKLSGIEAFGLGIGVHVSHGVIAHFTPPDPTFNHLSRRRSIKIFNSFRNLNFDQFAAHPSRSSLEKGEGSVKEGQIAISRAAHFINISCAA
jgi:hypothetical protein